MNFEGYKLRGCIFKAKSEIENYRFDNFTVEFVGENGLGIVKYCKYRDIINDSDMTERQLHEIIDYAASRADELKDEAAYNRFNLFEKKVDVGYLSDSYSFEIKGVGPQAIKLTRNFTYDEIAECGDCVSEQLYITIRDKYSQYLENDALIKILKESWQKEESDKKRRLEKVKEEEEIRCKKLQEIEEFLAS
ncbi:MAG: hypothetical protein IJ104_04330 [Methanobrevibacter sp.]|nr:hypothetical protein [Methanobrevibacter sp.]